jgi:hypothetical protein
LGSLAQDTIALPDSILPNTRGCERNLMKLATKLTESKENEKEKFDAIFTWVLKNIGYDYRHSFSPPGSPLPKIKKLLRKKRATDVGYAYLMDTLCHLAGIKSVMVSGYVKDFIFDVNDSLYMDNHTWNAVKLDNYWYVYDVSYSSRTYGWKLTKFSQRVYNYRKKIREKKKSKKFAFKRYKGMCYKAPDSITISYLPFKYRLLLKLLRPIPLRGHLYFSKSLGKDFYLANPGVFAITHFPDNFYWSLTNIPSIRDFETDSAYYHLKNDVYLKQKRQSRFCLECDNYFSLDQIGKPTQLKNNSYNSNKRNTYVTSRCDYQIASIYYQQSIPETDSATKINLIDSSLFYLASAKKGFRKSMADVANETNQQKIKNVFKQKLLLEENKNHARFIHDIMTSTEKETARIKSFSKNVRLMEKKLEVKQQKLSELKKIQKQGSKLKSKEEIRKLQLKLKEYTEQMDMLNTKITALSVAYNNTVSKLCRNMQRKLKLQDSLSTPFLNGCFKRLFFLYDNYKKIVVEDRKNIEKYKARYALELKDSIFVLSDSFVEQGTRIFNYTEERNSLLMQTTKLILLLEASKAIDKDEIKRVIEIQSGKILENRCWLLNSYSTLYYIMYAYMRLEEKHEEVLEYIRYENHAEKKRYNNINQYLTRRKMKLRRVPVPHLNKAVKTMNVVRKSRRQYLEKLKEEKKKLREKARK